METKKNANRSFNHLRTTFFLTGMVLSLVTVLGAFSYTVFDNHEIPYWDTLTISEPEPITIIFAAPKKVLPAPKKEKAASTEVTIVPDEIEIPLDDPEADPMEQPLTIDSGFTAEKIDSFEVTDDPLPPWVDLSKMAEFKGGQEALYKFVKENLHYPPKAVAIELERKIMVQFVVWKDGSIRNIEILNPSPGFELLQNEAIRLIEKMNQQRLWIPAEQRDKKVSVWFVLPIDFQL